MKEGVDIQTSTQTTIREIPPSPPSWRDSSAFKTAEALRPWAQWLLIIVLSIGSVYMLNRDTNAEQGANLHDLEKKTTAIEQQMREKSAMRDRQISDLKGSTVSTELFKERTDNIQTQLTEIKADQKEILNRLPPRQ